MSRVVVGRGRAARTGGSSERRERARGVGGVAGRSSGTKISACLVDALRWSRGVRCTGRCLARSGTLWVRVARPRSSTRSSASGWPRPDAPWCISGTRWTRSCGSCPPPSSHVRTTRLPRAHHTAPKLLSVDTVQSSAHHTACVTVTLTVVCGDSCNLRFN